MRQNMLPVPTNATMRRGIIGRSKKCCVVRDFAFWLGSA
jgi:hypothetical protein